MIVLGLIGLAILSSCVIGIAGIRRDANPTRFTRTVDEDIDKTRRIVSDYLEAAENEPVADRGLGDTPSTIAVQDFTDGSVHLTLDSSSARLMEITATFKPLDDGSTRVEVFSNAEALGQAVRPRIAAPALHREIRKMLGGTLTAIDDHRVAPGGFLISRLIADARGPRLGRERR